MIKSVREYCEHSVNEVLIVVLLLGGKLFSKDFVSFSDSAEE